MFKRAIPVFMLLCLLGSSCIFGGSPTRAADELSELANKVETATYAAVYRFSFTRQNAPGQATRMEITQQPPTTVRKLDESTAPAEGKPVTLTSWYIHNPRIEQGDPPVVREGGDFACNEYAGTGIRCQSSPIARTTFGSQKLDVFFDAPRRPGAFASVRKGTRPIRYQGQKGTCFEAVPVAPSPRAGSPEPAEQRYRYELCYADDGVLLSGSRSALDDGAAAADAESFVEATSVSRVVEASELRLPGKVVDVDDLPQ